MNNMETTNPEFQSAWESPREAVNPTGFSTTVHQEWKHWGVGVHNVWHNGRHTGKRHITYHDEFVNTCSKQYIVLPNEQVVETVEKVLQAHPEYGLVPDRSTSGGKWCEQNGNMILSKKTSVFPAGTSMMTRYVMGKELDPSGDGRPIKMGIAVSNSIDLTRGFSIMPYHFRPYCTNSMYHVSFQSLLSEGNAEIITGRINTYEEDIVTARNNIAGAERYLTQVGDDNRKRIQSIRHTKRLTEEFIEEQIVRSLDSLSVITEKYAELARLKLSKFHAQRIVDSMPKTSIKNFDFIETHDVTDKNGNVYTEADVKGDVTQWEAFNAMTDYLSHGSLNYNSTVNHFREVDSIFMSVKAN